MPPTKISYAEHSWNPIVGCPLPLCSDGCKHCWARDLHNMRHKAYLAGKKVSKMYAKSFEVLQFLPERLEEPLRRKKPTVYFVGSQTDIFHEDIPGHWIGKIYGHITTWCPQHTFIILTKRLRRMEAHWDWSGKCEEPNIFHYLTICNQAEADEKIPKFLDISFGFHGICIEPMLSPVDLRPCIAGIDHVIVGCESGPKRRSCGRTWIPDIVAMCRLYEVPVYVKQIPESKWGRVITNPDQFPGILRERQLPWIVR